MKGGNYKDRPCLFPFNYGIYKNVSGCVRLQRYRGYWCPTELDEKRNFDLNKAGFCPDKCEGKKKFI